ATSLGAWTLTETATPNVLLHPTFKDGSPTPADYLEITASSPAFDLGIGQVLTFTLASNFANSIASNATIQDTFLLTTMVDPPTPNPAVPEPASLALLGVAAA